MTKRDWVLSFDKINSLQDASIERLMQTCKGAHYINVMVRINGEDRHYEADWIKHLLPQSSGPAEQAPLTPKQAQKKLEALVAELKDDGEKDGGEVWCCYTTHENLMRIAITAFQMGMRASSEAGAERALPFVVEYRRKPEHQYRGGWEWVPMAAFDVEGAAEDYVKSCSAGDPPWEYRVRPQPGATDSDGGMG